jgi:hypothetical protein
MGNVRETELAGEDILNWKRAKVGNAGRSTCLRIFAGECISLSLAIKGMDAGLRLQRLMWTRMVSEHYRHVSRGLTTCCDLRYCY